VKILVVSDIHSNWEAWQAVMPPPRPRPSMRSGVSGFTGYGPDPGLCVDDFRSHPNATGILGNHDRVVAKLESPVGFNPMPS